MSLWDRIKSAFASPPVAEPLPKPKEFREAVGVTVDADEDQWRKLTGDGNRDLAPLTQDRMQKLAHYVWEQNLLANRLIELPLAYALSDGVTLSHDDPDMLDALDAHWDDPINQWDLKLEERMRELALFGELCWPTFVNEHTGHVRIGYLDPCLIGEVVKDPDNAAQPIGIITKKDKHGRYKKYRVIINGPEEVFTSRTQKIRETFTDGECFFYRVNGLITGGRGRSDLLAQVDWLDGYDRFLFGELDRSEFLRAFIWDVTLKNATPEEVKSRAKEITNPNPGSVRVHNDSEEWNAVSPDLGQYESATGARLFRNHILGGATIPEHWYGGGGDVNRATAGEMGDPTFKMIAKRQQFIGHVLRAVGMYVLRQKLMAERQGEPDPAVLRGVSVTFPEMVTSDTTAYAAALQQVVVAVGMAIERGLMSEQTGVRTIEAIAERLGVDFDAEEELATARAEAAGRKEADTFTDLPTDQTPDNQPPKDEAA